ADLTAGGFHPNLARDESRGAFALARSVDAGADEHAALRPALDHDRPVVGLHGHAADGGDGLLADFAMAGALAVAEAVLAGQLFVDVVLHLGQARDAGGQGHYPDADCAGRVHEILLVVREPAAVDCRSSPSVVNTRGPDK